MRRFFDSRVRHYGSIQVLNNHYTCLESLSTKALDAIGDLGVKQQEKTGTKGGKAKPKHPLELAPGSARAAVKKARQLLDIYEYEEAERTLASIRINGSDELPELVRAARMFTEEIGAYDRTIETLLSQPKQVINNKDIRELLALTYYNNSMTPEARAVFDSLSPVDLGKAALYAWADIACNDGTLSLACNLLRLADEKEGLATARAGLKKDIEAGLLKEAEPALQRAVDAFQRLDFNEAALLTREVLSWYPGCQRARKLLGEIESTNTKEHINELWQRFNQAEGAEEKLGLLARLLERDREQKVRIRSLIDVEKTGQKRKLFDKRMGELRELSAAKSWSACFATVRHTSTPSIRKTRMFTMNSKAGFMWCGPNCPKPKATRTPSRAPSFPTSACTDFHWRPSIDRGKSSATVIMEAEP